MRSIVVEGPFQLPATSYQLPAFALGTQSDGSEPRWKLEAGSWKLISSELCQNDEERVPVQFFRGV